MLISLDAFFIFFSNPGLSTNILCTDDKLPMPGSLFKNSVGNSLPALKRLGELHNLLNFIITFSLM